MPITALKNRAFIKITGEDKWSFLQNLVTQDIQQEAHFSALLSPQGKILFDFFIVEVPEELGAGYLIDIDENLKEALLKKLTLYKLRAKVTLEDLSAELHAYALWGQTGLEVEGISYLDPRTPLLGMRIITFKDILLQETATFEDYELLRIQNSAPNGGQDYAFNDIFPHEANMDTLNALSFTKGCFVGQEIVARMQHRATTRKRFVPYQGQIEPFSAVYSGETLIGHTGSCVQGHGLALMRLDRMSEATQPFMANGQIIEFKG